MNSLLVHVRKLLHSIGDNLIGGQVALSMTHVEISKALVAEEVPLAWLHPNLQPTSHTLFSWIDGTPVKSYRY